MTEMITDHTERMVANPREYGYSSRDELAGLTQAEMMKGVTKDHMIAYGQWLCARAKKLAADSEHDVYA